MSSPGHGAGPASAPMELGHGARVPPRRGRCARTARWRLPCAAPSSARRATGTHAQESVGTRAKARYRDARFQVLVNQASKRASVRAYLRTHATLEASCEPPWVANGRTVRAGNGLSRRACVLPLREAHSNSSLASASCAGRSRAPMSWGRPAAARGGDARRGKERNEEDRRGTQNTKTVKAQTADG